MTNQNISINVTLNKLYVEIIDSIIKTGEFTSRAEVVRHSLQRTFMQEGRIPERID